MSRRSTAALLPLAALLLAPALAGRDAHAQQHQHAAHKSQPARAPRKAAARYVCPMHPDVVSAKPGDCPECGMFLKAADEKTATPATPATTATTTAAPASPSSTAAPAAGQLMKATPNGASAGYFPNHVLLTQDNKPVRFYEDLIKGKVVLINFMFTTCTGVCPPMTANLAKVQQRLGDRVGRDVVILSISVDPTVDTPDKLKKYAATFKARPGWYFLTGEKQNVDWVLYKLGGYVEDRAKHSGVLIIGNEATGEWLKTAALHDPARITEAVVTLLGKDADSTRPAATP